MRRSDPAAVASRHDKNDSRDREFNISGSRRRRRRPRRRYRLGRENPTILYFSKIHRFRRTEAGWRWALRLRKSSPLKTRLSPYPWRSIRQISLPIYGLKRMRYEVQFRVSVARQSPGTPSFVTHRCFIIFCMKLRLQETLVFVSVFLAYIFRIYFFWFAMIRWVVISIKYVFKPSQVSKTVNYV